MTLIYVLFTITIILISCILNFILTLFEPLWKKTMTILIVALILFACFIGLKIAGVIDWSWFWVLSPVIILVAIPIFFVILFVFLVLLIALFASILTV